jgi:FtsH-binding integral membrane protein
MLGVYNHMTTGLGISGLVALALSQLAVADGASGAVARAGNVYLTQFGYYLYATPLKWVLILAPLAFIFIAGSRMMSMSPGAARATFWAFAAVMGASLSTIFLVYTSASIVRVFFITAAAFGALSLYGYTTKKSLSGWGSFLMMGVVGIFIACLVNLGLAAFGIHFAALTFAISIIGVLIFAGLTAYETQQLKEMYLYGNYGPDDAARVSVFGALNLYLDFINMFQFLLVLIGDRR